MRVWTAVWLVLATITGVASYSGVAGASVDVVRTLFFVFLILLILFAIAHTVRGRPPL